jgi:hypothetical protein
MLIVLAVYGVFKLSPRVDLETTQLATECATIERHPQTA